MTSNADLLEALIKSAKQMTEKSDGLTPNPDMKAKLSNLNKGSKKISKAGSGETSSKKKKPPKFAIPEDEKYKILSIGLPEKLVGSKNNCRYQTILQWKSKKAGGRRVINFGKRDATYYIDHRNPAERDKARKSIKNADTPFKPNYYVLHILNGMSTDLRTNYFTMLKTALAHTDIDEDDK